MLGSVSLITAAMNRNSGVDLDSCTLTDERYNIGSTDLWHISSTCVHKYIHRLIGKMMYNLDCDRSHDNISNVCKSRSRCSDSPSNFEWTTNTL